MSNKTFFVRLKPYSKRRGFLVVNFMTGGVRFTTRWTEVSARKARQLEEMVQPHDPEAEIPLFDIKTKAEAEVIEMTERDKGLPTTRVKEAEAILDSKFRDDRPRFGEDGELENPFEPAELIAPEDAPSPRAADAADADEVAPAPSMRRETAAVRS